MSLSNLQAQIQDILFDKGSTLIKTYYYLLKSSGGVYSAPDLTAYQAAMKVRLTYGTATALWSLSSSGVSPALSIITTTGAELEAATGLPISGLTSIWGVRLEVADTITAAIDWKPQVRLPLTGLSYDSAVYDIELSASGQPTFKIIKGRLFAAEEVTKT